MSNTMPLECRGIHTCQIMEFSVTLSNNYSQLNSLITILNLIHYIIFEPYPSSDYLLWHHRHQPAALSVIHHMKQTWRPSLFDTTQRNLLGANLQRAGQICRATVCVSHLCPPIRWPYRLGMVTKISDNVLNTLLYCASMPCQDSLFDRYVFDRIP